MKVLDIITEAKTQKAEAPKPRNFVAKNAINTGAGAHKDKKKAAKQGDVKHKAKQFAESQVDEISLGDYRKKAAMQKAQSQMGAMFGRDPEQKAKDLSTFYKREKGLNRLKARDEKSRKAEQDKQLADLVARLPQLKAEYEQMKAKYKSLGGSNWQYADREQNLTASEREARSMEGPMNNLWRQIQAAEKAKGVGESRVTEKAVSKAQQKFMGMVYAAKKGEKPASPEVAKVAKGMSKKSAKDYAATKHKDLPGKVGESATAGSTSAANMSVGAVYPNKTGKTLKNKDGTAKNALDVKGVNLMTGGSIKR